MPQIKGKWQGVPIFSQSRGNRVIRMIISRLTVNGKIFQLRLMDEVKIDSCSAKRSQTTGLELFLLHGFEKS